MRIFHFDAATCELIGQSEADIDPLEPGRFLIPAHATDVEPPYDVPGSTRHFIAGGWEYREIPEPPPEPPAPTAAELRRAEILARLRQIDVDAARPAREVAFALAGGAQPPQFAVDKLAALEVEAAALRQELAGL